MAVPNSEAVQWLLSGSTRAESRSGRIGPITLEAKQTGERSAGNPHAAFDEAGAGNVARPRWSDTRECCVVEGDDRGEAYTTIVWGVGLSHEMAISQGPRRSMVSKAICAAPSCKALSPCRGLRPHHARKDRVGTWETSSGPQSLWRSRAAAGRRGAEAAVEQARSRTSLVVLVKRPNKAAMSGGGG